MKSINGTNFHLNHIPFLFNKICKSNCYYSRNQELRLIRDVNLRYDECSTFKNYIIRIWGLRKKAASVTSGKKITS